jgi:hypothetical protein
MATKSQSLLGGLAGSILVNVLAEGIRKNFRTTPRLDKYGKQGLDRITEGMGIGRLPEGPRYWTALAGDLAINTLVFALSGAGSRKRTIPQGLALGAVMAGTMMLAAKPAGIDPDTTGENKKEKGMTVAYYLLGGLAAAGIIRLLEGRNSA